MELAVVNGSTPVRTQCISLALCAKSPILFTSTFEGAFAAIAGGGKLYSEFNIVLNYAWYFHHDEYAWHLQVLPLSLSCITPFVRLRLVLLDGCIPPLDPDSGHRQWAFYMKCVRCQKV